jgi:hypothetical protein
VTFRYGSHTKLGSKGFKLDLTQCLGEDVGGIVLTLNMLIRELPPHVIVPHEVMPYLNMLVIFGVVIGLDAFYCTFAITTD